VCFAAQPLRLWRPKKETCKQNNALTALVSFQTGARAKKAGYKDVQKNKLAKVEDVNFHIKHHLARSGGLVWKLD